MRMHKISVNKARVRLDFKRADASGKGVEETTLSSPDRPRQEFLDALNAFRPFVRQLCGFTPKWMEEVNVTSVSISDQKGDRRGVVISSTRPVADANAPFVFSTPVLTSPADAAEDDEEGDTAEGSGIWLPGMDEALVELEAQAKRYLEGVREQGDLFEGGPEAHRGAPDEEEVEEEEEEEEPAGVDT